MVADGGRCRLRDVENRRATCRELLCGHVVHLQDQPCGGWRTRPDHRGSFWLQCGTLKRTGRHARVLPGLYRDPAHLERCGELVGIRLSARSAPSRDRAPADPGTAGSAAELRTAADVMFEVLTTVTCRWSVRNIAALIEKQAEFRLVDVADTDGGNKAAWYTALTPFGKTPALRHGDRIVVES